MAYPRLHHRFSYNDLDGSHHPDLHIANCDHWGDQGIPTPADLAEAQAEACARYAAAKANDDFKAELIATGDSEALYDPRASERRESHDPFGSKVHRRHAALTPANAVANHYMVSGVAVTVYEPIAVNIAELENTIADRFQNLADTLEGSTEDIVATIDTMTLPDDLTAMIDDLYAAKGIVTTKTDIPF